MRSYHVGLGIEKYLLEVKDTVVDDEWAQEHHTR